MEKRLLTASAVAAVFSLLFVFWPLSGTGSYSAFILQLRAEKLLAMFLLAVCGGIGTVIFQTITANRLLTPQLMGVDGIYRLFQASLILIVGNRLYTQLPDQGKFAAATLFSMAVATFFYVFLLNRLRGDVYRLLLVGVIFSVFCRTLTEFIGRLLDPLAYALFQSVTFAQISQINLKLLGISVLLCGVVCVFLWRRRHVLDVMALGRETAVSLGIHYLPNVVVIMLAVSLLVAVATALVGPMLFFGLLAAALTYRLFPTARHSILLPGVVLVAHIILTGGQIIFERLLNMAGTLSIAVEFVGGLLFLLLIVKRPVI